MHPTYEEDLRVFETLGRGVKASGRLKLLSRRFSPREIMGIIRHCELLLACRLGSAVLAAATGTPTVAIAYEPRMREFMEHVGLADRVFDWRQVSPPDLLAALSANWGTPRPKETSDFVAKLKAEAQASIEALEPLGGGHVTRLCLRRRGG